MGNNASDALRGLSLPRAARRVDRLLRPAFRIALLLLLALAPAPAEEWRPRLIVLTDIGGDPDDQQSMIRLMLYSNEFDIEGLIASASGAPGELKQAVVQPRLIREIVEA